MAAIWRKLFQEKCKENETLKVEFNKNDYEETLRVLKWDMKVIGIRLASNDSVLARRLWSVYFWLNILNPILMAVEILGFIVDTLHNDGFTINVLKMTPCFAYLLTAVAKSYKMEYNLPLFEKLVRELRDMWAEGAVDDDERKIYRAALKEHNIVIKGYRILTILFFLSSFGPPIGELVKINFFNQDLEYIVPFHYWSVREPFEKYRFFFLFLLLQTLQGFLAIWLILSADSFLYIMVEHITTQYKIITARIQKLFPVPVDRQLIPSYPLAKYNKKLKTEEDIIEQDNDWDKRCEDEIKSIIKKHITLFELTQDLDNMYSFSMFIHFLNASTIICFCCFCSVFIEDRSEMIFKGFLVLNLVQAGLLSWYGQNILDASGEVTQALYNCGWYTTSKKIATYILIMLRRSQKEARISIYGVSAISLATFTTVVKTAWSYFTLIVNIYEP